jgi:hypothetical protein
MFGPLTCSFAVVLVASVWMVIAQPLDSIQHSALLNVYNGLGSFLLHHPQSYVKSDYFFFWIFCFFFFHRMQHNHMSSIRFECELRGTSNM